MQNTERAVERLTETHVEVIDKHASTWPPLLDWLDTAVRDKIKRRDGSSGDIGVSLDFGMLAIQDRIKRECWHLMRSLHLTPPQNLTEAVSRLWSATKNAHAKNELTDADLEHTADSVITWEQLIDSERGHTPRKLELTVPCPSCGNRWALETDHNNPARIDTDHPERNPDEIRKAAIVIEFTEGRAPVAECRVAGCEKLWAGWAQVAALGVAINANQDHAVLAACGIDVNQLATIQ